MEETDITTYDVLDAAGMKVGQVVHTSHTAVKGFKVTETVEQTDATGKAIVSTSWSP